MSFPHASTLDTNVVRTRFPGRELTPGRDHHPLDQLTVEEIGAAAAACRERAASLGIPALRFNSVSAKVVPGCVAHSESHALAALLPVG